MEFVQMETGVIEALDTREVQRLRRLKQLGLVHLVWPGAEHSRFSHSLGAAHLALRCAHQVVRVAPGYLDESLLPKPEDVRAMAIAAMCHDIGHGPLSHVWEREVIRPNFDRAKWREKLGLEGDDEMEDLHWHELVTQALLAWPDGELHQLLERHEHGLSASVAALLRGTYPNKPYLARLLASDVDCDRCDFVLRDAINTGVAYGRYDIDWLISTVTLGFVEPDGHRRPVVGFDDVKAQQVLEQFLIARLALYDTVYQHRTVRAAEAMVGLFLRRMRTQILQGESVPLPQARPFAVLRKCLEENEVGAADLLELDDDVLWLVIRLIAERERGVDPVLVDLARRITSRRFFKPVSVPPAALRSFRDREDARAELTDVASKKFPDAPDSYFFEDSSHELLLSDKEKHVAYLVDTRSEKRTATRLNERQRMAALNAVMGDRGQPRIFAAAELTAEMRQVITGR